jgi:hypothetical protein
MEPGGCCYVEDTVDDFFPTNLEDQFDEAAGDFLITSQEKEKSETMSETSNIECCICFEVIGKKNNCTTECGHQFCFKCLATALTKKNACPCCRAKLVDEPEEEEEDGESDYADEDDEYDYEDGDEQHDIFPDGINVTKDYDGDVEDLVESMEKNGVTMLDLVSLLYNKFSKKNEIYTPEYIKALCEKVDQINLDCEQEYRESEQMASEDPHNKDAPQEQVAAPQEQDIA